MRRLEGYNEFIQRKASNATPLRRMFALTLLLLPLLLLTIFVGVLFDVAGWRDTAGMTVRVTLQLMIIAAVFYTGVKFISFSSRMHDPERR